MFDSQNQRQLCFAAVVVGLLTVAGCSNQRATEGTKQPTKSAPAAAQKAPAAKSVGVEGAPAAKPTADSAKVTQAPQDITVPKNTAITATVGETLTSEKNHTGDSFSAQLSTPVEVDGKVVLPKGTRVTGRVVKVKKHELKVALTSIVFHGKSYDLKTNSVRPTDKSQATNTAKLKTVAQSTKEKNDNSILPGQTQLTFKLAKAFTLSAKG